MYRGQPDTKRRPRYLLWLGRPVRCQTLSLGGGLTDLHSACDGYSEKVRGDRRRRTLDVVCGHFLATSKITSTFGPDGRFSSVHTALSQVSIVGSAPCSG